MLRGYLELLRPANVVTAIADVLAGYAVAGRTQPAALPWLVGATMCLYAGGVVLNDVFDRHIDAVERPERPIPSGRVPASNAAAVGAALLAAGLLAASRATRDALIVAAAIAALVILYDGRTKRHPVVGPINMGLCRGLNLLLGVSAVVGTVWSRWPIALFPVIYIAAVTAVSRGEVHGGRATVATAALISLTGVVIGLLALAGVSSGRMAGMVLVAALAYRVLPAYWRVVQEPRPLIVRRAVKAGILSLVLLDSAISAMYAGPLYAAAVLATGLVAGSLARVFSVT